MLEILEDTKDYYTKHPDKRGLNEKFECVFYNEDTRNKCAVGRYLTKNDLTKLRLNVCLGGGIDGEAWDLIKSKKVKSLPVHFWDHLQDFHDSDEYWDEEGISKDGILKYKEIRKKIKESEFGIGIDYEEV